MTLDLTSRINQLITRHREAVASGFASVEERLDKADRDYARVYRALGIDDVAGLELDKRHLEARFLYNHSGLLIQNIATECLLEGGGGQRKVRVPNLTDGKPKTFEIDVVLGSDGVEIKWKDATTDGDHVAKEMKRVNSVKGAGLKPIRLMFFEPSTPQSFRIQEQLAVEYPKMGGEFHRGLAAFDFVRERSGIDMLRFLP